MSRILFDHIAIAVPSLAAAPEALVGQLGGMPVTGGPSGSGLFRWGQWRFAGGGRLEIIEPMGSGGFVHRFLDRHGAGVHHVTFKVPSVREACARAEARGYGIVGYYDADPRWAEAFLHPKEALGIVVQLSEWRSRGGEGPRRWHAPPGPPDPPPPVTLLGLRMRAHSRERAEAQWGAVLEGEGAEVGPGELIYRWPGSPLELRIEIDPAGDEGPVAIEYAADHPVLLPEGRHPVLGAVFSRRLPPSR